MFLPDCLMSSTRVSLKPASLLHLHCSIFCVVFFFFFLQQSVLLCFLRCSGRCILLDMCVLVSWHFDVFGERCLVLCGFSCSKRSAQWSEHSKSFEMALCIYLFLYVCMYTPLWTYIDNLAYSQHWRQKQNKKDKNNMDIKGDKWKSDWNTSAMILSWVSLKYTHPLPLLLTQMCWVFFSN